MHRADRRRLLMQGTSDEQRQRQTAREYRGEEQGDAHGEQERECRPATSSQLRRTRAAARRKRSAQKRETPRRPSTTAMNSHPGTVQARPATARRPTPGTRPSATAGRSAARGRPRRAQSRHDPPPKPVKPSATPTKSRRPVLTERAWRNSYAMPAWRITPRRYAS
jgi:hypothetical protein